MATGGQTRGTLSRRRHARRPVGAMTGVFLILGMAGLLFATSAETAKGTQLRTDPADAVGLLRAEQGRYAGRAELVKSLQQEVDELTQAAAGDDGQVAGLQARSSKLVATAGLAAVAGPAIEVTLDDAPRDAPVPPNAKPDDLVVHQQDVQAVVNALWAGGAEAVQLMDQRVISTSAVRCVGNTLILQGRVYSPPYRVIAIGPVNGMRDAIETSPQIDIYQQYVQAMGLRWSLKVRSSVTIPAFSGSVVLRYARVPGGDSSSTPSDSATSSSATSSSATSSSSAGSTGSATRP